MSVELAEAFFERDLSPAEAEALELSLERSPEAAERLLALAERDYQATGLPTPRWAARRPARLRGAWLWLALLVAGAGTALALGARHRGPLRIARVDEALPMGRVMDLKAADEPGLDGTRQEAAAAGGQKASAFPRDRQGRRLGVVLRLKSPTQAQVFVRAKGGATLRRLFEGRLEAGDQRVEWDGLDEQGKPAQAGVYEVVVRSGGQDWVRTLRLRAP